MFLSSRTDDHRKQFEKALCDWEGMAQKNTVELSRVESTLSSYHPQGKKGARAESREVLSRS